MRFQYPEFDTKEEFFAYLIANKGKIERAMKSSVIYADTCKANVGLALKIDAEEAFAGKAAGQVADDATEMCAKLAINTTNLLDSHGDVHIPGLWTKSLKETRGLYHLQEHNHSFKGIISDEVEPYCKTMSWEKLGFQYEGKTQVLIFDSTMKREDNPFMFDLYRKGKVKEHSVGMQYVKIALCINNAGDGYKEEKENWDNYIDQVANRKDAEARGWFWAVLEARVIEGSAVLRGSNPATPTIEISDNSDKGDTTENEPDKGSLDTQPDWSTVKEALKSLKETTK